MSKIKETDISLFKINKAIKEFFSGNEEELKHVYEQKISVKKLRQELKKKEEEIMEKLPYVAEFKTSIGIVIKQFVTEETILKLKELEHSNSQTHKEFEIGVIKLLILDTYRIIR